LSTDDEDQAPGTSLTDTNYRNHWLEIYLVDEERWISIEPFTMKIDCSTDMEKRFGKQILYVCGYDNDNKVKDLTKRYAAEWLTSVRRSRIGQLDPKKLWWERTLMFYQPIEASLDIQEEMQLKSNIF
jgi:xeroderma pigmentosum group C-complementing protein